MFFLIQANDALVTQTLHCLAEPKLVSTSMEITWGQVQKLDFDQGHTHWHQLLHRLLQGGTSQHQQLCYLLLYTVGPLASIGLCVTMEGTALVALNQNKLKGAITCQEKYLNPCDGCKASTRHLACPS